MDAVLQACSDELDKIAAARRPNHAVRKARLKQLGIGAAVGIASTVPFYTPIHAGLHRAGRHKANLALLAFNTLRGAAYGTILAGVLPSKGELKTRYKKGTLMSGGRKDMRHILQQAKSWMPKSAFAVGTSFGKNVGKSWGRGSSKGGLSTSFKSAGMGGKKEMTKAMPKLPGLGSKTPGIKPPKAIPAERNNQVTLRRGLSNIELPSS